MALEDNLPLCWRRALIPFIRNDGGRVILDDLENRLNRDENNYYPTRENIFAAFHKTHFNNVKVVIVGQDPYPNGNATGFAFSTGGVMTGSLENIDAMVQNNTDGAPLQNGNLEHWADQGVLLLNRVLTFGRCDNCNKNLHEKIGWKEFTKAVLKALSNVTTRPIHFVFWGVPVRKFKINNRIVEITNDNIRNNPIINGGYHHIYPKHHPSPLNAANIPDFVADLHFQTINGLLGADAIDWIRLPPPPRMACNICDNNG